MRTVAHAQRGAVGLMLVALILVTLATTLVINQMRAVGEAGRRIKVTNERLEVVRKSLINFVSVNGRLPCPADGALNTGQAVPVGAAVACGPYPVPANGTVPWATLGLARADSFDGWDRKISYRVYAGPTGLTIATGADMSNCDLAPPSPVAPLAPARLCNPAHTTSGQRGDPIGFLSAADRPGLTVNDASLVAPVTQVGFALISHGQTGFGAWLDGGSQMTLPPAANVAEFGNTQVAGTYFKQLYSDKTVAATAVGHFDDEVLYMSVADLINESGRVPRRWAAGAAAPIVGASALTNFNSATLALDTNVSPAGPFAYNSPVITLAPPFATPMIISTGLGYVLAGNAAGTALGVCSATLPCTNVTSQLAAPEYLSFLLTTLTARKVSLGLLAFGAGESVQVSFRRLGVMVGTPITVVSTASLVGLVPTVAGPFDEVIITPLGASAFYVQSIRFCDAASAC